MRRQFDRREESVRNRETKKAMTLPKKGLKTITVDNHQYVWSAKSDDDGGFKIAISSAERKGQLLLAYVDIICSEGKILIITNYIIRQIIILGLMNDWSPKEEKPPLSLARINEKVDLSKATYWRPNSAT